MSKRSKIPARSKILTGHSTSDRRKLVKKTVKKADLEAFSRGQLLTDMMAEEQESGQQKALHELLKCKKQAKMEVLGLSDQMGQREAGKVPLVLLFATDLNGEHELFPRKELFNLLQGLLGLKVRLLVIDTEQRSDINDLGELSAHAGHNLIWYNPKQDESGEARAEKEIDRLLLAADLAIVFNQHHELLQLLQEYGVVSIAEEISPFLENYRPNEETGNAFLFDKKDLWSVFAAAVRALETYKFPYDWQHIVRKVYKI